MKLHELGEDRLLAQRFPSLAAGKDVLVGPGAGRPRLTAASKLGFKMDTGSPPLNPGCKIDNAIFDGEDYKLLFAVAPRERKRLQQSWRKKFPRIPLTRIGCLNRPSAIGNLQSLRGYVHFK